MQFIRRAELANKLSIHKATISRWVRQEKFPPPVRLGENIVAWREADVQEWLDEREADKQETASEA